MKRLLLFFWYFITAPGYILLWMNYYFPTEWGKKRNVAFTARNWRNRKVMAPIFAFGIYLTIFFILLSGV